jgi:murein DD-endopeptidase MepM/ murein hydrolase activator NlpD
MSVGTLYTPQQIAQLASNAGFRGQGYYMAVAIALAESGGKNVWTPIGDTGLWQINYIQNPRYTRDWLLDVNNNAKAAYQLSNGGQDWRKWCTAYSDGLCGSKGGTYLGAGSPYQKYLTTAKQVTNVGSSTGGAASGPTTVTLPTLDHKPWWQFPRVDNLGGVEPFGGFPKPDSNIQVPAGYPVEALLSGTVSGTNQSDAWGASVTIKLDRPLNNLATHTAYLHLRCDLQVRNGQHVSVGQRIAYNGSSQACGAQKVPLGFALYAGDLYGHGDAWKYMTRANLNGGPLDPVPLLNQARSGKLNLPSYTGGGTPTDTTGDISTVNVTPTFIPLLEQVHETLINTPGFYGIALAVDEAEKFPGWIDLTRPPNDIHVVGVDTGIAIPDIVGEVRSVGATIGDNFLPFAIRSGTATIGIILLLALLTKLVEKPVKEILPLAMEAAAL